MVNQNVCTAGSGQVAWATSISATQAALAPADIAFAANSNVFVSDQAGPSVFEVHSFDPTGATLGTHQDTIAQATGPYVNTNLFVDPSNNAFYGFLFTQTASSMNTVFLNYNEVTPAAQLLWNYQTQATGLVSMGAPSPVWFAAGGDSSGGLHSPLQMGNPPYFAPGVWCFGGSGGLAGVSAGGDVSTLAGGDFGWITASNTLAVWKQLTSSSSFCNLTVPAAGAVALAELNNGCTWSNLLALPTASVLGRNFRLGADGSYLAAVVFSGTVDFGGGALTAAGPNALAIARFSGTGSLLWAQSFGSATSSFTVGSLGGNAAGDVIVTAGYSGTVDLGAGALSTTADTLLAAFDATGALRWNQTVTVGGQGTLMAAAGTCGLGLATNSPNVDLGFGPISTVSGGVASIGVAALGL